MHRFAPPPDAPASWKLSFHYDLMEVYGERPRSGYARAYETRRRQTFDLIGKYARPGARVIDVAAAQGNFSLKLAELGYDVTWNDLRAELAPYVEKKRSKGSLRYLPGNVFELATSERFDVVLITEVIEHVAHPDDFLRNAAELLAPGGCIVMTTPNGEYFRNRLPKFSDCPDASQFEAVQFRPDADGHIFLLHSSEVIDLASAAGLEVLEMRLYNNPLTIGALGMGRLVEHLPVRPLRLLERVSQRVPPRLGRKMFTGLAAVMRVSTT